MSRDVVLDIIFAKMIGREYLAGVDCEWAAFNDQAQEIRALATKGLVRKYAGAIKRGDTAEAARITKAMDEVAVAKALEMFQFASGPRQVEVRRDPRGRFTRYLSAESSPYAPAKKGKGQRVKGEPAADPQLAQQIQNLMEGKTPAGVDVPDDNARRANRERGRQRAGAVRAISLLQDEMIDLFGETDDVYVIVEKVPEEGEEGQLKEDPRTLGLKDPVTLQSIDNPQGVLPIDADVKLRATYGMKSSASQDVKDTFNMLGGLVDVGMRPETAVAYARGEGPQTAGMKAALAPMSYTGKKKNTNAERARRHFETAETLGGFFADTGISQLQSAGRALQATAKIGQAIPDSTYEVAERANFRYRGMKDNLPKAMTQAMGAKEHKMLMAAFSDPELTPEKWRDQLTRVGDYLHEFEVRNPDAFNAEPYRGVLAATIASVPAGVSPRDFLDRYNRDLAIMALIPELPADDRAVKLGEAAGFGVPSSGVVTRPDGAFKEMYRGVGPDHYLPFSAKALPELRDGQYVRTRYRGGLTNEDISVIVASGARKGTVVSGSGVFSIELKPDTSLEGRMKSPEVAAMGERYERILDQVAASGIYMKDLEPAVKERLHNQAAKFSGRPVGDRSHEERYKLLVDRERAEKSQLTQDEIDVITESVTAQAKAGTLSDEDAGRTTEMLVKEALADARKEKVRAISLNAEGYAMAMETLRLQYPSIIRRVHHETLKEFVADRGLNRALDPAALALRNRPGASARSNYVDPGETRPLNPATRGRGPRWSSEGAASSPPPAQAGGTTAPTAPTAPAAGAGGAPAAGAGGGVKGTEVFRNLYSERQRKIDEAAKAAVREHQGGFMLNASHVGFDDVKKDLTKFLASALAKPGTNDGAEAALDAGSNPGFLAFMGSSTWAKAAEDDNGLTLGMALAYGKELDRADYWENAPEGETARLGIDDVMSTTLLSQARVVDKPMPAAGKYAFYIPPEVGATIPKEGDINPDEVLAAIDAVAYDTASPEGKARANAKKYMDALLAGDEQALMHGKDADGIQDVSVLGLLALQAKLMDRLDMAKFKAQNPAPEDVALLEGLTGGDEGPFFDQASFNAAKEEAIAGLQGAIGTEFMRRALGGGDAGPKELTRVQKADRPLLSMLESFLAERAVQKASRLLLR